MKKLSLIKILKETTELKSSKDLMKFLQIVVPFLIKDRIVDRCALKQCSEVAPLFTYFAEKEGFQTKTVQVPNHYYSIVKTSDGVYKIDLTYIQFMMPDGVYEGDEEYYEELQKLLKKASDNPFSVVKIEKIDDHLPSENAINIKPRYAEYFWKKMYGIKNDDDDWWK